MKFLPAAFLFIFFLSGGPALALELSEEMLNQYVRQKITEKTPRDIQVLDQKISLQDGFATICATIYTKVFQRNLDFCADMTPKWQQGTGSLHATKMSLISLNISEIHAQDVEWLKILINRAVLPGLEGVEIYRADNFIGEQISWLKIVPGKVSMGF